MSDVTTIKLHWWTRLFRSCCLSVPIEPEPESESDPTDSTESTETGEYIPPDLGRSPRVRLHSSVIIHDEQEVTPIA